MSQEAYEALRRDLLGGRDESAGLYRRLWDVQAREAQWQAAREQAQSDGLPVPSLLEDAAHAALVSERRAIMEAQRQKFARPRLDATAVAALRAQLTPDEKSRLRQDLLTALQSSPPEIKDETAAALEEVAQRFRAQHGSTPEVEAALAKVERLKEKVSR